MHYEEYKLNAIQEERIIEAYFDDGFIEEIQGELESFINKKSEDIEAPFLQYDENDIDKFISYHKKMVEEGLRLKNRDFSTSKFKDSFYVERR